MYNMIIALFGILFGQFLPRHLSCGSNCLRLSVLFEIYFPLMIVAYVTMGNCRSQQGAGKLLVITSALLGSHSCRTALSCGQGIVPELYEPGGYGRLRHGRQLFKSYFSIRFSSFGTLSAVALGFSWPVLSTMKGRKWKRPLQRHEGFFQCHRQGLNTVIIPLLPFISRTFTI